MKTASAHYRKAKQLALAAERTQKLRELIFASDNFTEADREVAEAFEASELLAEFMAEVAT
jgi:hypothetical protein